jgi:hypothetical protein
VPDNADRLLGTTDVAEFICDVEGKEVILLDTPGFDDTYRSDADILNSIADYMKEAALERVHLSGLIYLHSIHDVRMTGSSMSNMRLFRALCGDENLKKVVIATTKWELTEPKVGDNRFEELKDSGPNGVWSAYIAEGAQVCKVKDNTASASALISKLLAINRKSFIPQIQREMMAGSTVAKTAAGRIIDQKFTDLKERHEKEIQNLHWELEHTRRDGMLSDSRPLCTKGSPSSRVVLADRLDLTDSAKLAKLRQEQAEAYKKLERNRLEQERLHETQIQRLERDLKSLEDQVNTRNTRRKRYRNYRRWISTHWYCRKCGEKSSKPGKWTCLGCDIDYLNKLTGP